MKSIKIFNDSRSPNDDSWRRNVTGWKRLLRPMEHDLHLDVCFLQWIRYVYGIFCLQLRLQRDQEKTYMFHSNLQLWSCLQTNDRLFEGQRLPSRIDDLDEVPGKEEIIRVLVAESKAWYGEARYWIFTRTRKSLLHISWQEDVGLNCRRRDSNDWLGKKANKARATVHHVFRLRHHRA